MSEYVTVVTNTKLLEIYCGYSSNCYKYGIFVETIVQFLLRWGHTNVLFLELNCNYKLLK